MTLKTTIWDAAEQLDTPEAIAAYLEAMFEDGDPAMITHAIGTVARAKGMTELAREIGVSRETLYRSLSEDGNPAFSTVLKIFRSFGLRLEVKPADSVVTAD
jgi:probable addiction module antidote protein